MIDLHVQFSVAMVIAAVLGELVSYFFYNHHSPWGRRIGERYFLSAVVCQAILVIILQWIMGNYYSVSNWEDAAYLSLCLSLVYFCLEGPHIVHNHHSFSHFFFHAFHKFCVIFVMVAALVHFRHY